MFSPKCISHRSLLSICIPVCPELRLYLNPILLKCSNRATRVIVPSVVKTLNHPLIMLLFIFTVLVTLQITFEMHIFN